MDLGSMSCSVYPVDTARAGLEALQVLWLLHSSSSALDASSWDQVSVVALPQHDFG